MITSHQIALSPNKNISPNSSAPPNGTKLITHFNGIVTDFDTQSSLLNQSLDLTSYHSQINTVEGRLVPAQTIQSVRSDLANLTFTSKFGLIIAYPDSHNFRDGFDMTVVEPLMTLSGLITKSSVDKTLDLNTGGGLKIWSQSTFDFAQDNFTIEWRFKPTATWTDSTDVRIAGTTDGWTIKHSNTLIFCDIPFNVNVVTDQTYYYSLTRLGDRLLLHIDGVFQQEQNVVGRVFTALKPLNLGRWSDDTPDSGQPCHLIGFKTTKGEALFNDSNYNAPTGIAYYGD